MSAMTADEAGHLLGVSRETLERLRAYAELLIKWQDKINLVSASTLPDLWRRHILDSGQLFRHLPDTTRVVADLGSGAGFPGLVLAAMGVPEVHLLESDTRKCAFMREAARVMGVSVTIHPARIERISPFPADVVTSRALASLSDLISYAEPFLSPPGEGGKTAECLFLKGRLAEDELTLASKEWNMTIERLSSLSDPDGLILRLSEVTRGPTAGRRRR
jgi:16S rRNA (guanine527-N7)-methyltransferase